MKLFNRFAMLAEEGQEKEDDLRVLPNVAEEEQLEEKQTEETEEKGRDMQDATWVIVDFAALEKAEEAARAEDEDDKAGESKEEVLAILSCDGPGVTEEEPKEGAKAEEAQEEVEAILGFDVSEEAQADQKENWKKEAGAEKTKEKDKHTDGEVEEYRPHWRSRLVLNQQARRGRQQLPAGFRPRNKKKKLARRESGKHDPGAAEDAEGMQIFVRMNEGHSITLDVHAFSNIDVVKAQIRERVSSSTPHDGLRFGFKQLDDSYTLFDYDIHAGATLDLRFFLPGGARTKQPRRGGRSGGRGRDGRGCRGGSTGPGSAGHSHASAAGRPEEDVCQRCGAMTTLAGCISPECARDGAAGAGRSEERTAEQAKKRRRVEERTAEQRQKRQKAPRPPDGAFTDGYYTEDGPVYESRRVAMEDLGCGRNCRGHAARVAKTSGPLTFLHCRLYDSQPPCGWRAMLFEAPDGAVTFRQHASQNRQHEERSAPQGRYGFDTYEEHKAVTAQFLSRAIVTPQQALRDRLCEGPAQLHDQPMDEGGEDAELAGAKRLQQFQNVKKALLRNRFSAKRWGDLAVKVESHREIPHDVHKGYLAVGEVKRPEVGAPMLTLMATTRNLQRRWAEASHCTAHIDGGHKFNLLGWPVSTLGVSNPAGVFGLCGLGLTSSTAPFHITALLSGFQASTERLVQKSCAKHLGMSDAEIAYRVSMQQAFACKPLMCWYHVKAACKLYLTKHYRGSAEELKSCWGYVMQDLDWIHAASCRADFDARCMTVKDKWRHDGLPAATAWIDGSEVQRDFVSYFGEQWEKRAPEWFFGASRQKGPTTNNQCERRIRQLRTDSGGVVGNVVATIDFLLSQVEFESKLGYCNDTQRRPTPTQWLKAKQFLPLFQTTKVQPVQVHWADFSGVYICHRRADGEDFPFADD